MSEPRQATSSEPASASAACPSRAAIELIGSKWALRIFPLLAGGPMRNGELRRRVQGISQKMLTQTLRELERNGLVTRTDLQTVPPHVEYRLSELGRSLSQTLVPLDQWVEANHRNLADARSSFDGVANGGQP